MAQWGVEEVVAGSSTPALSINTDAASLLHSIAEEARGVLSPSSAFKPATSPTAIDSYDETVRKIEEGHSRADAELEKEIALYKSEREKMEKERVDRELQDFVA